MPENTVALLSLGCAKNLVDSERIASILEQAGVRVTAEVAGATVAIVNTCGFIESAKEESIEAILDTAAAKQSGGLRTLIVTGCLSERYSVDLEDGMPEVDAFIGIDPKGAAQLALRALGMSDRPLPSEVVLRSRRLTPGAWSYLRVADGCDNCCAYCAIPLIRGPLRSHPYEGLLGEARYLAEQGVKEINLIAQDTTAYGIDSEGRPRLHELVHDICRLDGPRWVRVLYMHPAHVYDELLEVMACEDRVVPYFDIPLQHANDEVLRRMGRKVTRAEIEGLVEHIRAVVPGATLRTTFLVGFPGETDEQFEDLLDFVAATRFDRAGCFTYSAEEGTPAAEWPGQVPSDVAEDRLDALMSAQQEIAFELARERIGERTTVLVEEERDEEGGFVCARSPREAPDVDPVVLLDAESAPAPGTFADVEIVQALGYDCIAELSGEGSE